MATRTKVEEKPVVVEVENTTPSTVELKEKAMSITKRRTLYAAGAGLIPLPVVDVATIFGIQLYMIRDLAKVYNVDFKEQRARALITSLVGDLATVGIVSGVKAIPLVGSLVGAITGPVVGAASTYALGKVFTQHFDQGGTLLSFDPVASRKYFQEAYEEGKLYVEDLQEPEEEMKTKRSRSFFGGSKRKDNTAELAELRQQNEKMQAMIADLQKSIAAMKK